MTIVYCANRAIYHLLPTTLNSLLTHNKNKIKKIYLFIEDNNIEYINHPLIKFININNYKDILITEGINCTKRFPYMAMVRCYLPQILKENKVIYIDVDTTVVEPLTDLWNFNLGSKCLAARAEHDDYFNSGVLLMDLAKMRALNIANQFTRLLTKCRLVFPDQDAINIVLKGQIATLPYKFNALGRYPVYEYPIAIRHYAGIIKPWKENADPDDIAYWNKYYTKEINYKGEK